jgi:vesicle-fusing ATPase
MTPEREIDAAEANRTVLEAELARVRSAFAAQPAGADGAESEAAPAPEPGAEARVPAALERLTAWLDLTPFERDVLVACAGVELDAAFARACADAPGATPRGSPTFGLALAAFPGAHWSALAPQAPLRAWRLVEVGEGPTLVTSPLRIDERILHFLLGVDALDARLDGIARVLRPPEPDGASVREPAERLRRLWSGATGFPPPVRLVCDDPVRASAVAAHACAALGLDAIAVRAVDLPPDPAARAAIVRLVERECLLRPAALVLELDEGGAARGAPLADAPACPLVGVGRGALPGGRGAVVEVPPPSPAEQRDAWRAELGEPCLPGDAELERLAHHFTLEPGVIADAAADARDAVARGAPPGEAVWRACRVRARGGLDALAQRIETAAGWDDLVLPPAQLRLLREVAEQVRHRATVHERWGFSAKGTRGLGTSALFTGDSGTGKTLAAEVVARELSLDLYRIDLSSVVSKWVGETEKNLRRVFDAAEASGAVLLFDEADALFGRRTEVKDGHDRYANVELAYLLQRMEAYRGLAILTTNVKGLLDPAFLRRIRFVVAFPFPEAAARAEIWRRVLPAAAPVEGIRVDELARLGVSGGHIRNIALNAAFLAAAEDVPIGMPQLLRAARVEYAKLERPLGGGELGGLR